MTRRSDKGQGRIKEKEAVEAPVNDREVGRDGKTDPSFVDVRTSIEKIADILKNGLRVSRE